MTMNEIREKIEQLARRIAEKEDELQLLKDDLDALRAAIEATLFETDTEALPVATPSDVSFVVGVEPSPESDLRNKDDESEDDNKSEAEEQTQEDVETEQTPEDEATPPEPDHEVIMRTIESFANKPSSIPNKIKSGFGEQESLLDRISSSHLNDIRKAMGINERFLYANELFFGDMTAFTKAVEELNHLDSYADAERMLEEELAIKYNWDDENQTVIAFKSLVSRRFT